MYMSETAVELQQQLVERWKQMDAQFRYSTKKRSREEEEDVRPMSKTLNVAGVNTAHRSAHETQAVPGPH